MLDISISNESDGMAVDVTIPAHLITLAAKWIQQIHEETGPDRDVGPVRFETFGDGSNRIHISAERQGPYEWEEIDFQWVPTRRSSCDQPRPTRRSFTRRPNCARLLSHLPWFCSAMMDSHGTGAPGWSATADETRSDDYE